MKPEDRIRQLEERWVQIYTVLQDEELSDHDFMTGSTFARLLDIAILEYKRQKIDGRDGTFADWSQATQGIRFCHNLMKQLRDEEAELLKGWSLRRPQNEVQTAYSFLYEILVELGHGVVEIEENFPEMDYYFAHIRAELPPMARSLQV